MLFLKKESQLTFFVAKILKYTIKYTGSSLEPHMLKWGRMNYP